MQGRNATAQLGEQLEKVGIESPVVILASGVRRCGAVCSSPCGRGLRPPLYAMQLPCECCALVPELTGAVAASNYSRCCRWL